jgi:hypothetical protein
LDMLTFITELTKSLAWPIAALLFALMIRKPIAELVPLLRKLKYKEIELEFSKQIAELKAEIATPTHPPLEATVSNVELPDDKSAAIGTRRDELIRMASISARVAIMEAWLEVEVAATEVASSFWSSDASDAFRNYSKLGEYLFQCKVIDKKQLGTFKQLQQLRNRAAHAQELDISEEDTRTYVELAVSLAQQIRSH